MASRGRLLYLALAASLAIAFVATVALVQGWRPRALDMVTAGSAAIGGPFALVTQTGAPYSDTDLRGAPYAIFFGYTHCPDVCPTTLVDLTEALKKIGSDARRLKILFVTLDPARDTPAVLKDYLQSFDPRIVGLSGAEEKIAAMATSYKIYWRKVPGSGGDYSLDHSASVLLIDAHGEFAGTLGSDEAPDIWAKKLSRLAKG
jgi:protein SCO1/2